MSGAVIDAKAVVRAFLREEVRVDVETLADGDDLLLSGILDSLAVVSLVVHLETELGVQIPPVDVTFENFATLDAIAAYLANEGTSK